MINEQIKQLVNVLQAYVNGKTIQYYDVDYSFKIAHPGERNFNNKWVDVDEAISLDLICTNTVSSQNPITDRLKMPKSAGRRCRNISRSVGLRTRTMAIIPWSRR